MKRASMGGCLVLVALLATASPALALPQRRAAASPPGTAHDRSRAGGPVPGAPRSTAKVGNLTPGFADATASESPGFDARAVVRIEVVLGSSGALDGLCWDPHPGD